MRVLLFLLLSLFMLPAFSADNLLRWHDAQHFTVQASTPLKAKRAWKLCALYPSLKDSYWLSLNYGMQEAARRYGVDLKVLEAGGYSQLATQQAQIDQCKQWGAEAILLGSSTTSFPDLQKQVASLPVIELVNAIDAPQVKKMATGKSCSRWFAPLAALLMVVSLSGCFDKEGDQRKAFIDFLQNTVMRSGERLPTLTADQKKQFGPFVSDYAILPALCRE